MKKIFITLVVCCMVLSACKKDSSSDSGFNKDEEKDAEKEVLTPTQQKAKLESVGKQFVAQFNETDFSNAWRLANECYKKFEDYNYDVLDENFGELKNFVGRMSERLKNFESNIDGITDDSYVFSMPKVSGVYTANERTRKWTFEKTKDNSLSCKFTNKAGDDCELVLIASDKTYNIISYWTVKNYRKYGDRYAQPFEADVPANIEVSLKEAGKELMHFSYNIDLEKNDHFNLNCKITLETLRMEYKVNISKNQANANVEIYQHNQQLISTYVEIPDCNLIEKRDNEAYQEWFEKYSRSIEEKDYFIGKIIARANILERIQIVASSSVDPFQISNDIEKIGKNYPGTDYKDSRMYNEDVADYYNDVISGKLYYSSDVVQADVLWDVTSYQRQRWNSSSRTYENVTCYDYEPVIHFPNDNSKYAFGDYFTSRIYGSILDDVEDLCNKYLYAINYFGIKTPFKIDR